jgi:hypothetical protein
MTWIREPGVDPDINDLAAGSSKLFFGKFDPFTQNIRMNGEAGTLLEKLGKVMRA